MAETEITSEVPILDALGRPCNFGWARAPFFTYDSVLLMASRRNISECDRYIVFSPTHLIVMEILDDGYLGYICVSVLSFKDKERKTYTYKFPFSLGSFDLPKDSDAKSIKLRQNKSFLNFAVMEDGIRIIKVDIPGFDRKLSLRGQIVLSPPPEAESLYTHMPWRGRASAFSYSRRSPWYFAEGVVQYGTTEIVFSQGSGWGIFDWSRGVRPRSDLRFWASGCGLSNSRQAGFSVGFDSADSALVTENAFFLDGKLHKLDMVSFHMPSDREASWRFTSNDNRLDMNFSPSQERDESHQMFFYSLKRRQLFGSFSGKVILDDGSLYEFNDITGIAERKKCRL